MDGVLTALRQQWAGFLALFLVVGGVAAAGAGVTPVRLGGRNQTDSTTGIRNTGGGPALELRVDGNQPALGVSNDTLIERLNAAFLRGMTPSDFAPASGSPNYADVDEVYTRDQVYTKDEVYTRSQADDRFAANSGDPSYLSPEDAYTKAEADRRYAPISGSREYADRDSVYTRREADDRYAPAEGSTNYLGAGGPQVLISSGGMSEVEVGKVSAPILLPTDVTAPDEGTIMVIVSGFCTRGDTGPLALRARVGREEQFTEYEESGVCTTVAFKHVLAREKVSVAAHLTTKVAAGGASSIIATAQVLFQPFTRLGDAAGSEDFPPHVQPQREQAPRPGARD